MRDLWSSRLPKPHPDLGEGGVSPFFRRDGDGFRRSSRRCDRRSAAAVIFPI
jgi:hypothetical protein